MAEDLSTLVSCLQVPDDPIWRQEAEYSPEVAHALLRAYGYLKAARADPKARWSAYRELLHYRGTAMSEMQRLHVEYAHALIYSGEGDLALARVCVNEAMELAGKLEEQSALVELGYLAGALSHQLTEFPDALSYYERALQALDGLQTGDSPVDVKSTVDLLSRSAGIAYELALFDVAEEYLQLALAIHHAYPRETVAESATIGWVEALLLRQRGEYGQALTMSLETANAIRESGTEGAAARIYVVVAEIALEQAETFRKHSDASNALIALAKPYAARALQFAHNRTDVVGEALAALALQRSDMAENSHSGNLPELEAMMRTASQIGDIALVSRTESTLGHALAMRGERTAALNCYERARRRCEEYDLRARALITWRAQLRLREQDNRSDD